MGGVRPRRLEAGKQAAERRIGGQTARTRRDKNPVHESTAAFGGARRLQPQYHAGLEREVSALRRGRRPLADAATQYGKHFFDVICVFADPYAYFRFPGDALPGNVTIGKASY